MHLQTLKLVSPFVLPLATHAPAEAPDFVEYILHSNVVNVVLAVLILAFLIKKMNVGAAMEAGRVKIASELTQLEQARKEAEDKLQELKRQTGNLSKEVEEILGSARSSAEKMSEQILTQARLDSEKIIETAKKRIEMEQKAAAKELEKRLLADALQDARLELAQNLNAKDQQRSVETFLEELQAKH